MGQVPNSTIPVRIEQNITKTTNTKRMTRKAKGKDKLRKCRFQEIKQKQQQQEHRNKKGTIFTTFTR